MNEENYKYTEEDVEGALRFLRLHVPEFATPENAIKLLVYMREQSKKIEDISDDEIEKVLEDLESY